MGPNKAIAAKHTITLAGLKEPFAFNSRKALNPSGKFCINISAASNKPLSLFKAKAAPRAMDSGIKSVIIAANWLAGVWCFAKKRSSHINKPPPSINHSGALITLAWAIPSGTSTSATADSSEPPPKAITEWRNSSSNQAEWRCSSCAISAPSGIAKPAAKVSPNKVINSLLIPTHPYAHCWLLRLKS